ncbi:hypothetical protein NMY22_g14748 [Coprinellus aureogranulatus]|nr:hypothetical protein NMY22_g14748 [Coprinellus aureogranulatus]
MRSPNKQSRGLAPKGIDERRVFSSLDAPGPPLLGVWFELRFNSQSNGRRLRATPRRLLPVHPSLCNLPHLPIECPILEATLLTTMLNAASHSSSAAANPVQQLMSTTPLVYVRVTPKNPSTASASIAGACALLTIGYSS